MTSAGRAYLKVQQWAQSHTGRTGLFVFLLVALATSGISRLELDLSFRPLFASGEATAGPTREFESVFGQSSGSWISAVIENRTLPTQRFLQNLSSLSNKVGDIPHVIEVSSLTTVRVPQWNQGEISYINPIPEALLYTSETDRFESFWETLREDARFVDRLVSADGARLLLGARLDLPLEDLDGRRAVVEQFTRLVEDLLDPELTPYFTGVSVVELAYETAVLRGQLIATGLTSLIVVMLLYWAFGTLRAVIVCLTPVGLAIPATLGVMGWLGIQVSIINTTIPALILVVGVGDAVHMLTAWLESRGTGRNAMAATRVMLVTTGTACFFTTVTTMGGFLSLLAADLDSVGRFGLCAALGVLFAWLANQLVIPLLLRHLQVGDQLKSNALSDLASGLVNRSVGLATSRPRTVTGIAMAVFVLCLGTLPSLQINQHFNEELPPSSPVSQAQRVMETDFGGFLGPEISIRRVDGSDLLDDPSLQKLDQFGRVLRSLPETRQVWTVLDLLPEGISTEERAAAVDQMRAGAVLSHRVREVVNDRHDRLAVMVRVNDIGTNRAALYRETVTRMGQELWGPDYRVEVVGQWWLAQYGMQLLLGDMLTSFFTALLVVLPIMWLVLGDRRLLMVAAVTNVLPLLVPLAYMAVTGTALRVSTVVILAIVIGIAVDNTFHMITRLRSAELEGFSLTKQSRVSLASTGRAVVLTTLILICGFLSMTTNQLQAIRDMGLVASVAIAATMLADLLVLPALLVLFEKKPVRVSQGAVI